VLLTALTLFFSLSLFQWPYHDSGGQVSASLPVTAEPWVQYQTSPYEICGE
jgi:hypothetical protein